MDFSRFSHALAILFSSALSVVPHGPAKAAEESKAPKKLRKSLMESAEASTPSFTAPYQVQDDPPQPGQKYPWRNSIVTTTFWIGENPTQNNPVPNHASSWDVDWAKKYGGTDTPDKTKRADFKPVAFTPGQNPFYIALPYNDKMSTGHKPEASRVVPWFNEVYSGPGKSVLKGRWVAVRYKGKVCYAQWEDCGPFRTDHWQYVFGTERPKPNLNRGAGLDVSPAVRDFLGMNDTDVTDWRFCEFDEIPQGPWAQHGDNNTFVQKRRESEAQVVDAKALTPELTRQ